jgi:hypothetical protein
MKFSDKLSHIVEGQNHAALCRRASLPPAAIGNYIHRGQVPNALTGLRLAKVLGVSPEWLYSDDAEFPIEWSDPSKMLLEIVARLPVEKVTELTNAARKMELAAAA